MATATTINFYSRYATEHLVIDEDEKGLFCQVCSETHEHTHYTVRVDESGVVPVATSCNCPATKPCKHINLVNRFYARIYKSNVVKAEAKAAEAARVEAEAAVAEAEKIVSQPVVVTPVATPAKDMMLATLTKQQGFRLLR